MQQKMNLKKRLLSALLTLIMVAGLLPTVALAAEVSHPVPGGSIKFDKDTKTITGFDGDPTQVTIPSTIGGVAVESIGRRAFESCITLTSVTIENGVKVIGNDAFSECENLTSVTIPDSVTLVGDDSFCQCKRLASVTIGNGVKEIGGLAFYGCENLASVTIPDSVTKIGNAAFSHCISLTSIRLPNGLTHIGENMFEKCRQLTSVTIPDSVTEIGKGAFSNCEGLTSINLPNGLKRIGDGAFISCYGLTSVTIPDSVTEIGESAFSGCGFTSVTIPGSVTDLGGLIFRSCAKLTSVKIENGVPEIADRMFENCVSLTSVTIPNSVTRIGSGAFESCDSLKSVTIPDSVTVIGWGAFKGCDKLTSVKIGNSVTGIAYRAFENCTSLMSVTIPDSVKNLGESVFDGCRSLTSIEVNSGNSSYSSKDGVLFNKDKTELILYPAGKQGQAYIIPKSVKTVRMRAFKDCTNLTTVTIPNSVTKIEDDAFDGCSNLRHVIYNGGQNGWSKLIKNMRGNGELLNAELHYIYFTLQPQGGTILPGKSHTVTWETSFEPVFLQRYKDGVEDKGAADYSDPTITSEIISKPGVYYYRAFYEIDGVAHVLESDEFTVTGLCSITFDPNGGEQTPPSATAGADGKLTSLPTITRTGYTFKGWYTAPTGGSKVDLNTVYTMDTVLYAQWIPTLTGSVSYNGPAYVGQEVISYRDGELNTIYYSVPSGAFHYRWEISNNGSTGWTEIDGATTDRYVPVTSDAGKFIRVRASADGYTGSVCGGALKVSVPEKSENYGIPATPVLTTASPYATVTITNAKASQEYVFNYTGLQPSDWSGAQSPAADGTLTLNVESGKFVRVYTRYKETETTKAGTEIRVSAIPAYDFVELEGMDFDKNELIVVQPGTYELNFVPAPDDFEWGARPVKWTFDNGYVQLYKDAYGLWPISSGDKVNGLTRVYVRGTAQTAETIIKASAQVGGNFYTAYCSAEVSDGMQQFALRHLDFGGEKVLSPGANSAMGFSVIPGRAAVGTITFEKVFGPASALGLEIRDVGDARGTLDVSVPATAEEGTYVYSVEVDGVQTPEPSTLTITVLSEKATVTFDANGGLGSMAPETVLLGDSYRLPACGFTAPDGMAFDRWDKGNPGDYVTVFENTEIMARWRPREVDPPVVDVELPLTVRMGEFYYASLGGDFEVIGLPDWLWYDDAFKEISGEPTEVGTYTFTLKATNSVGQTASRSYTVTVLPAAEAADIDAVATNLDGKVGLLFYVTMPDYVLADEGAYAVLTLNTKNGDVTETQLVKNAPYSPKGSLDRWQFSYYVVAKQMHDKVTLNLYLSDGTRVPLTRKGEAVAETGYAYSVIEYCDLAIANSSNAKMVTLAKRLKAYGEMAQIYFDYRAEGLVPDADFEKDLFGGLAAYAEVTSGECPAGLVSSKPQGMVLILEEETTLRVNWKFETGADPNSYEYKIDDKPATLQHAGSDYFLAVKNISSKKLGDAHKFTISKDGKSYTWTGSALTWANTAVNKGGTNAKNVGKALYLYNQAARDYFNY